MRFYKYWAMVEQSVNDTRGKKLLIKKWGGSNDSQEDAARVARKALDQIVNKVRTEAIKKSAWSRSDAYAYDVRDIPEEVIGEPDDRQGLTRNRNGCVVLNAADAMFVDIDKKFLSGILGKIFGNTQEKFLLRFEEWMKSHPDMGVRVYRTFGGLRYLFTHAPIAVSEQSLTWLKEMSADPLYVKLCKTQECYRARLTPKPWRIGLERPKQKYPYTVGDQKSKFAAWLSDYENKSGNFAVCHYVTSYGNQRIHAQLSDIVKEHDRMTKATVALPLA